MSVLAPTLAAPGVALRREWVWRWVLSRPEDQFTLAEAAEALGRSPRTIRMALGVLRRAEVVALHDGVWQIQRRTDGRILLASFHHAEPVGQLALRLSPADIEGLMVPTAHFTGPSAVRLRLGHTPADASEVWVYAAPDQWPAIEERFAAWRYRTQLRHLVNLRVWAPDPWLPVDPVCWDQVWVDLWQSSAWWSVPYLKVVEAKLQP